MNKNDTNNIIKQLEELELEQDKEVIELLKQQKKAKRQLLKRLIKSPTAQLPQKQPKVLSHSKRALKRGDIVKVRTTTSIGTKGDSATVLYVSPPRVDIYVHRVKDTSWRMPHNLEH